MLEQMRDNLDIFICPACRGELKINNDEINCLECNNRYLTESDIPLFFLPNQWSCSKKDVTDIVKSFYEKMPFPNYDDFENVGDLIEKARHSVFARLLDEQVPFKIRILEIGCGTGQLTNFLSAASRTVFGTDLCLNSLKLAQNFKLRNSLAGAGFYQMNLFRPIFREESFPLVICNGVLHHTSAPFLGFQSISRLVQKGGYIIIGLYNKYGRIINDMLSVIFKIFSEDFMFLGYRIKKDYISDIKKNTWLYDQYKNPYESKHTIGEVLGWFDRTGFDFINSIPKSNVLKVFSEDESLFRKNPRGTPADRFLTQAKFIFTGNREGGFFLMIGRRK